MQIPLDRMYRAILILCKVSFAAIGVCVFCALAPVSALFVVGEFMRSKVFNQLLTIIEIKITEIEDYFVSYFVSAEKNLQEIKARPYGGYEIKRCVGDFNEVINIKSTELLNEVNHVIVDTGRNFSKKQYALLNKKCSNCFNSIINKFIHILSQEFEDIETLQIVLRTKAENTSLKFEKNILATRIFKNKKIDIALRWSIAGVVISKLLSVIAIIISIIK